MFRVLNKGVEILKPHNRQVSHPRCFVQMRVGGSVKTQLS